MRKTRWVVALSVLAGVAGGCERLTEIGARLFGWPVELTAIQTCRAPQGVAADVHDPRLVVAFAREEVVFERRDGSVYACDVESGTARRVLPADPHGRSNESLAVRPGTGEYVLARGGRTVSGRFGAPAGVAPFPGEPGPSALGRGSAVARSGGAEAVWVLDDDGASHDLTAEAPVSYGLTLGGRRVAAGIGGYGPQGHRTAVQVWDLDAPGGATRVLPALERHPIVGVWNLHLASDGATLVADTQRGARSGFVVLRMPDGDVVLERDGFDAYWTRAVALGPNGRRVATGDEKGQIRLWDVARNEQVGGRQIYGAVVQSIAFSPDGRLVAVGLSDDRLLVFRVGADGEAVRTSRR